MHVYMFRVSIRAVMTCWWLFVDHFARFLHVELNKRKGEMYREFLKISLWQHCTESDIMSAAVGNLSVFLQTPMSEDPMIDTGSWVSPIQE